MDVVTFGVLALGCKNKNESKDLIKLISDHGFRYVYSINIIFTYTAIIIYFSSYLSVNAEMLGTMLAQACYHFNFAYVIYIMNMVKYEEIKPNKMFMDRLNRFQHKITDLMKKRVRFHIRK